MMIYFNVNRMNVELRYRKLLKKSQYAQPLALNRPPNHTICLLSSRIVTVNKKQMSFMLKLTINTVLLYAHFGRGTYKSYCGYLWSV